MRNIQSQIEERWNWITHGVGFILSIIGFFILLNSNSNKTLYSTFVIIIYTSSLLILYFASTAYHYTSDATLKRKFRVLDHISIYLLISGTYSPVTLISLIDSKGISLFIIVWSLAVIGTILKIFSTGRFDVLSVILYLIMGWLIVLDIDTLSNVVGDEGITYLMLGGAAYTIGIVFYALKQIPFGHVIWHLFVLAGSIFHYMFILRYVI
ncbi:PAQR family membrane homeostasis protein TrhA [Aquimarina algiphila]|uniref:Hemolysin III family protein n=1 Tax=Aquimarina algiphila TaxID=2047982 RepID=A0A554VKK9_9FLAO|nr:hemolysin III family protein [Aquimarina algiphila]TSE08560.1 hemolysin III family protein [Aquimarina algiphila]